MAIDKRRPQSKKKKLILKKRELAIRPRAVGRYLIVCESKMVGFAIALPTLHNIILFQLFKLHHQAETPAKSNPSTTVHLLVKSLNKFLQDFETKIKRH